MHLIVFDVDGTLVESDEFDGVLYAKAVRDVLDIEVDDDWTGYRHVTDNGILDEILDRHAVEMDRSVCPCLGQEGLCRPGPRLSQRSGWPTTGGPPAPVPSWTDSLRTRKSVWPLRPAVGVRRPR